MFYFLAFKRKKQKVDCLIFLGLCYHGTRLICYHWYRSLDAMCMSEMGLGPRSIIGARVHIGFLYG